VQVRPVGKDESPVHGAWREEAGDTLSSPRPVARLTLCYCRPARGPGREARTTRSDNLIPAPLAQSAERLHGKEKVYGSIP
jgi:hypothetical protein